MVIVTCPNNCLGPDEEPEHLRTYKGMQLKQLFPKTWHTSVVEIDRYLVAISSKWPKDFKTKAYIAVLNQGDIRPELSNSLVNFVNDIRYMVKVFWPSLKPIEHNRNTIVQDFLERDYDYLMMVDSDNPPPPNALNVLLSKKDIIGLPTPQWTEGDIMWVVFQKDPDGYRQVKDRKVNEGFQEVDAVGTGCIFVSREVLEKVKAPFERKWDENGVSTLGLDLYFCEKAKQAGFKVWTHWKYPCGHFKTINLIECLLKNIKMVFLIEQQNILYLGINK